MNSNNAWHQTPPGPPHLTTATNGGEKKNARRKLTTVKTVPNRHIKINYRLLILFVDAAQRAQGQPKETQIEKENPWITESPECLPPPTPLYAFIHSLHCLRKRRRKVSPSLLMLHVLRYAAANGVSRGNMLPISSDIRDILGRWQEADNQAKW